MIPDIYQAIFDKLVARTQKGEVNWKPTTKENTFLVNFKEFSLSITRGQYADADSMEYVQFQIRNNVGKTIDDFYIDQTYYGWSETNELFNNARRKALNIDRAVDIISKELESGLFVGKDTKKNDDVPF